jgi:drug/metabolite transporter (DMT)-like permease
LPTADVWETALAFVIWGSYGSVLTIAHIDPVLTAVVRTAALGVFMTIASGAVTRLAGSHDITAPIPWRSAVLWLSGAAVLADEILYSVSAVSGPVAIIGLAYGCVPVLVPVFSRIAGTDGPRRMRARHWVCLALAFAGNALILFQLHAAQIRFTASAVLAAAAALLFTALPIASAKLQQDGLGPWAVLKGQGVTAAILSALLILPIAVGAIVGPTGAASVLPSGAIGARSVAAGCVNAVAFTIVPFFLWYRGIARCGAARTSICCFAEPLVATLCSLVVLKDAPAEPALLAGVAIVLGSIVFSTQSADIPK